MPNYVYLLIGALALTFFFCLIFFSVLVKDSKSSKKSITSPEPFEKWIKGSGYENESLSKQRELYDYYRVIQRAAEEGSSDILPNDDTLHGAIAVAVIMETAKNFVTLIVNSHSDEVLNHPMCVRAFERAKSKGVLIDCTSSDSRFTVFNDSGMRRIEICPLKHSAQIFFKTHES